jgi:pimeloyl-ACP methyl ester carboxylesterase
MTKGTLVASYGIGGPIFSGGLRAIADEAGKAGWRPLVFRHTQPEDAVKAVLAEVNQSDPVALLVHSAGATFANRFAEKFGRPIDLGIYVDAWFPMAAARDFKRVISVRARWFGRFDVYGMNVEENVLINGTHTSIDDSKALRDLVRKELAKL